MAAQELLGVKQIADKNLKQLATKLYQLLSSNVYDPSDVEIIRLVRSVSSLKELSLRVKARGTAYVAALETVKFIKNAKLLAVNINDIPDSVLTEQYRLFLSRLSDHVFQMNADELDKLQTLDIMQTFLN